MYGFVQKNVRIVRIFFRKLYGFPLKMYGFLYGFFKKVLATLKIIILRFRLPATGTPSTQHAAVSYDDDS